MANGGRIDYTIGYNIDMTGIQSLKTQLQDIMNMKPLDLLNTSATISDIESAKTELKTIQAVVQEVQNAYNDAFDSTTGVTNINKVSESLKNLKIDGKKIGINEVYNSFKKLGPEGVKAFGDIMNQVTKVNLKFKETNNFLTKMGETLTNTIKWGISSSLINNFTNSIQQAWGYVQHLDTSLNDIRIVTSKSADEMANFAEKANEAASALGASTTEYTEAALIYYQQGLSDEEANARAETTLKAANVTGQTGREVSEELTAVWNGYKVTAEETEAYVDKLAAVAATTASDLEELSTGMSKVASAANNMGVDIDQLNAQLSTIISVTRQAPETAGTALKTIYARMEDLKINGEDEDGVKLGEVSSTLDEVGVHVMDTAGNLRDLGEVIEEVGNKWETWTNAQQSAIAQAIAGKRQYNNLLALFDNWDMYNSALETSRDATGTLQQQQNTYMESTAAHIQQLKTEWEDLYDSMIDTDDVNSLLDIFTSLVDKVGFFMDSIGGGKSALLGLVGVLGQIPGITTSISNAIGDTVLKTANAAENTRNWDSWLDNMSGLLAEDTSAYEAQKNLLDGIVSTSQTLTNEQKKQYEEQIKLLGVLGNQKDVLEEEEGFAVNLIRTLAERTNAQDNIEPEDAALHGDVEFADLTSQEGMNNVVELFDNQSEAVEEATMLLEKYEQQFQEIIELQQQYQNDPSLGISDDYNQKLTELEQTKNKLNTKLEIIEPSAPKQVANLNKYLDKTSDRAKRIEDTTDNYKKDLKNIKTTGTKAFEAVNNSQEKVLNTLETNTQKSDEIKNKFNEAADAASDMVDNMKTDQIGQGITRLVSGLSSVAFGFESIKNIGNIWDNKDISTGEKILQTVTSLSTAIPMLMTGVSSLSTGYKDLISQFGYINEQIEKSTEFIKSKNIADETAIALTEEAVIAKTEEAAVTEAGVVAAESDITVKTKETVATTTESTSEEVNTAAKAGNNVTTEVLIATIGKHIAARLSEKVAILGVTTSLGTLIAVAAGAVAGIALLIVKYQEEQAAIKAANNAIIENNNTLQEQVKTNIDLADSYLELYKQYKETGEVSDDLTQAAKDCTEQLNIQRTAVQLLAGDYDGLAKSIKDAKEEEVQKGLDSSKQEATAAGYNLTTAATKGLMNHANEDGSFSIEFLYGLDSSEETQAIQILESKLADISASYVDTIGGEIVTKYDEKAITELYDTLIAAQEAMASTGQQNTETYKAIGEWTSQVAEEVTAYKNAVQDIETYATELAGLNIDESQIINIDSFSDARDQLIEDIKEATGIEDDEKVVNMADAWLSENLGEDASKYMNLFNAASSIFDEYSLQIQGLTQEHVQEILTAMGENDALQYMTTMTEEDWLNLLGASTLEEAEAYIQTILDQNQEARIEKLKQSAGEYADTLETVIDNVISGDLDYSNIEADEGYNAIKDSLDVLLERFPELTDEATVFLTEGLVGTQSWTTAANELQEAFNELESETLEDNLSEALENLNNLQLEDEYDDRGFAIGVKADTEEFEEAIEEVLNAEYAIDVKLYTDGIEDFEDAETALDNIDDMASKIGDDFIVAADDIRELNNTFPGILDGMTYLADGTVQLNEEMVQSAMDAATEQEIANTEATATNLENAAAELRAKADMYDNLAEMAYEAAEDETKAQSAALEIKTHLLETEGDNDEASTNTEIDNSNLVADVSASDAETTANNWVMAYQEAAEAANEWKEIALQAMSDVENGEDSGHSEFQVSGNFKYTGSSAKGTSAYSAVLDTDSSYSSDAWTELGNELSAQAEAYRSSANDLEGAAAELKAKTISSANTNADAADGTSDDDDSSSSSSSEDEADTEEYLEREEDLYRAINEQLDDIESKLGRIDTIESHSWGADYLDTLEEENELLTAQLDLLETKKSTYESDLSSQQATLSSYGVTFSEDGSVMTNAEDVLDDLYAEYNSMVDSYNSMSADAQDDYQDTLDSQKDYIDSIEDAIDDYEDAYSEYNSVLDDLLDTHYELIENAVNQFNTTIDVHLELDEAETEWNEFWYEVVQDVQDTDFSGLFEESIAKLTTLVGTSGNTSSSQVAELTTHLNDTITEVQKQIAGADIGGGDSIFGDDTALSKETLETYRDSLIDAVTSAKEEIDTMQENYLKALDEAQNKIDEQVEGWEAVGDHIEHNIELIQMVSGSKAFEPLNKQFEQQYQNNLNLIETQKTSQDYWKERMEYYEQMMATEAEGSQMYQTYSDALEKASENYRSAVKDLDSAVKQALDDLEEWRKNQVSALEDTLDKALSGGMGLDDMQSEWDLILEKQNFYLDNVERALEMQDLEKDFSDVLDTLTTRNDLQQEFLKFQDEELSRLQQKDKLTQFDIDELRARLEIRKAELALEEAQQNKSNLRLRRDSQGNYTYQYAANPEDTEDAEDGIMSAKREWYELVKKRQEEVAENAIDVGKRIKDAWNEYQQALADEDDIAAENAKSRYEELVDFQKNIMGEGEVAKQLFYQGTADFFRDVNERDYLPIWNTTIEGMIDKWSNGGETSFVGAVSKGITDLDNLQQNFSDKTNEILTTAGVNYENLVNNGIDPTTEALEDMNDSNEELNETLDETNSLLDTLESELQDAIDAYDSLKDAAVAAIQAANQELETLSQTAITAIDEINNATATATTAVSATASSASSNSGSSSSGTSSSGTSTSSTGYSYKLVKDSTSYSGLAHVEDANGNTVASGTVTSLAQWKRKNGYDVTGLATGGYTGEWNTGISDADNGRLAILHQKELVLNESDTENILNAVTAVRDLVGSQGSQNIDIEGISNSIIRSGYITAQVLAQVGTNMLQAIASMVNNNNSEVQSYRNMTVNADFSGVRSADAIYQALMDLDNYGSQQAYSNAPDMNVRY